MPALVISLIALFVALGGSAYAISKNSVGSKQLKKNAVTTEKIKNDAVTGDKVAESTLGPVPKATTADAVAGGGVKGGDLGPVTTVSSTSVAFADFTSGSAFVQCPAGTTLLSGGGSTSSELIHATLSRKSGPNGWRFDGFNTGAGPTASVTVFAYCLAG